MAEILVVGGPFDGLMVERGMGFMLELPAPIDSIERKLGYDFVAHYFDERDGVTVAVHCDPTKPSIRQSV